MLFLWELDTSLKKTNHEGKGLQMAGFKTKTGLRIVSLVLVFLFLLVGCGSEHTPESEKVQKAVESFLTLYQQRNGDAASLLSSYQNDQISFDGFQGLFAEKITYSVKRVRKESDGSYVATANITNIDFKKIMEDVESRLPETGTEEDVLGMLKETIASDDCPMRTYPVEISVIVAEDGCKLVMTGELSNALLGGYNEYLSELVGEMIYEENN